MRDDRSGRCIFNFSIGHDADGFASLAAEQFGNRFLGGGSAYFLPQGTPGSKRKDSTNYLELFQKDGYKFVSDRTELLAAVDGKAPQKLLGVRELVDQAGFKHQEEAFLVLAEHFDGSIKRIRQS